MAKSRGLGRGLSSLIPTGPEVHAEPEFVETEPPESQEEREYTPPTDLSGNEPGVVTSLPIDKLHPNPYQPRSAFDDSSLFDLMSSVREHGVIQPIVVRKLQDGWQIVAGERRVRAAKACGLAEVPVRVLELTDEQTMEMALVENLQRQDLGPIEVSRALLELINKLGLTHDEIATKIGLSRAAVTNKLRLLQLPQPVIAMIERDELKEGHGRALLSLPKEDQILRIAMLAVSRSLNVRQVENMVREAETAALMENVLPDKSEEEPKYDLPGDIERLCKEHKLKIKVGGGKKGMGLSIRGLKRWQVELLLEQIGRCSEELFPEE